MMQSISPPLFWPEQAHIYTPRRRQVGISHISRTYMVYLEHSNRVRQVIDRKSNDSQNPQKGAIKKKRKCHITHSTAEYSDSTQSLPRHGTFILYCIKQMNMCIQLHTALWIVSGHTHTNTYEAGNRLGMFSFSLGNYPGV